MFGELNGAQLFSLTKSDFEKFCGKEEGSRLDSQIRVQKSLCGVSLLLFKFFVILDWIINLEKKFKYKEQTNELAAILEKRKEMTECSN